MHFKACKYAVLAICAFIQRIQEANKNVFKSTGFFIRWIYKYFIWKRTKDRSLLWLQLFIEIKWIDYNNMHESSQSIRRKKRRRIDRRNLKIIAVRSKVFAEKYGSIEY